MNGKQASGSQRAHLEERENELISEQETLQEELIRATTMLGKESTSLLQL